MGVNCTFWVFWPQQTPCRGSFPPFFVEGKLSTLENTGSIYKSMLRSLRPRYGSEADPISLDSSSSEDENASSDDDVEVVESKRPPVAYTTPQKKSPHVNSITKPFTEPTGDHTVKETTTPIVKPVVKQITKPVLKSLEQSVEQSVEKPVEKPIVKPIKKLVFKPVVQSSVKALEKLVLNPVVKPTVKPTIKPISLVNNKQSTLLTIAKSNKSRVLDDLINRKSIEKVTMVNKVTKPSIQKPLKIKEKSVRFGYPLITSSSASSSTTTTPSSKVTIVIKPPINNNSSSTINGQKPHIPPPVNVQTTLPQNITPNLNFESFNELTKFNICCIPCLLNKTESICNKLNNCNLCQNRSTSCQYSKIAKVIKIDNISNKPNLSSILKSIKPIKKHTPKDPNVKPPTPSKRSIEKEKRETNKDKKKEKKKKKKEKKLLLIEEKEMKKHRDTTPLKNKSHPAHEPSLVNTQKLFSALKNLEFENNNEIVYGIGARRRGTRKATKQDYKLFDGSDIEEDSVYDNNGDVILSEEEQDKRLLNGQVDDEFINNIEMPSIGPTAFHPISEDEFSD